MNPINIGVLSIQGDVIENIIAASSAINELGLEGHAVAVKTIKDITQIDGLIIPGGESTTIGRMSLLNGSLKILREKIKGGMPVLGICAGMIILAKTATDRILGKTNQPLLELLDIKLERNSFGRQADSFETNISMELFGISKFNGVFIRAPSITSVGTNVEVVSKLNNKIIAIKKENIIGTAFHPELTNDLSLHKYFVNLVQEKSL